MEDKNNFLKNLQNSVKDKEESLKHFNDLVLNNLENIQDNNEETPKK